MNNSKFLAVSYLTATMAGYLFKMMIDYYKSFCLHPWDTTLSGHSEHRLVEDMTSICILN